MGFGHRYDLLVVWLLALAAVLVALFAQSDVLRIALGVPFALVLPGYSLLAALFPDDEVGPGRVERLVLSFGLSLVILLLGGLVLNHGLLGIGEATVLGYLFLFITAMSALSWYRRWRLSSRLRSRMLTGRTEQNGGSTPGVRRVRGLSG